MTPLTSSLAAFADWLSGTPLSVAIQSVSWVVPLVQTIHILALAVVLSSVGMIGLRILGLAGGRTTVANTARRYVPWIWGALVIMLLTGVTLVIGEPGRSLTNAYFQWKMGLLVLGILLVVGFRTTAARNAPFWDVDHGHRPLARALAVSAFALFVTIAVLGRWIAYAV
jgi:hypothetical protein